MLVGGVQTGIWTPPSYLPSSYLLEMCPPADSSGTTSAFCDPEISNLFYCKPTSIVQLLPSGFSIRVVADGKMQKRRFMQ